MIGITGHWSGLGKSIYNKLDNVVGFDIKDDIGVKDYRNVAYESRNYTVFINNAYDGDYQIKLFKELESRWIGTNNLIINISSYTLDKYPNRDDDYGKNKRELEKLSFNSKCKTTIIRPGLMDTDLISGIEKHKNSAKMDTDDVADLIIAVIKSPLYVPILKATTFFGGEQ